MLRQIIEIDPDQLPAYDLLGRLYMSQKRLTDAQAEFERLVERRPESPGPKTMVATLLHLQNRLPEAQKKYEEIVHGPRGTAVASNNLAWLYATSGGDLDVALTLAQAAKRALPDRALGLLSETLRAHETGSIIAAGAGMRRYPELFAGLGARATLVAPEADAPLGRSIAQQALLAFRQQGPSDLAALEPTYLRESLESLEPPIKDVLNQIVDAFSADDAERIKALEAKTNHDVKAVEYFLKEKLTGTSLEDVREWLHFACTSEDINNLSHALMLQGGVREVWLPEAKLVTELVVQAAETWMEVPMLARTHGQTASPTTVMAMATRMRRLPRGRRRRRRRAPAPPSATRRASSPVRSWLSWASVRTTSSRPRIIVPFRWAWRARKTST